MTIDTTLILAVAALTGLVIVTTALLRAWAGWLELKRAQLATTPDGQAHTTLGAARIELADLRERIRKLEAIASGVEL